jgi:hypothetical protein
MTEQPYPASAPSPNTGRKPFYEQFGIVATQAHKLAMENIPELTGLLSVPIWTIRQPPEVPSAVLMLRSSQGVGDTLAIIQALLDTLNAQLRTMSNLMDAANSLAASLASEIRLKQIELQQLDQRLSEAKTTSSPSPAIGT